MTGEQLHTQTTTQRGYNPILAEFRGDGVPASMYLGWIENNESFRADLESDFTPEQIDHARRVLAKLAALS